jgi:hypothetical protein
MLPEQGLSVIFYLILYHRACILLLLSLGMQRFEQLSRSSMIIVQSGFKANSFLFNEESKDMNSLKRIHSYPKEYHLIAPAHVTHPWLYETFYPESTHRWLQFVREDAVENRLGLREVFIAYHNDNERF